MCRRSCPVGVVGPPRPLIPYHHNGTTFRLAVEREAPHRRLIRGAPPATTHPAFDTTTSEGCVCPRAADRGRVRDALAAWLAPHLPSCGGLCARAVPCALLDHVWNVRRPALQTAHDDVQSTLDRPSRWMMNHVGIHHRVSNGSFQVATACCTFRQVERGERASCQNPRQE